MGKTLIFVSVVVSFSYRYLVSLEADSDEKLTCNERKTEIILITEWLEMSRFWSWEKERYDYVLISWA